MRRKEPDEEEHWFSELDSLGIHAKRRNKLNDKKEMKDLVENIKQTMLQDYHSAYTE
jgi:hypothetical protein